MDLRLLVLRTTDMKLLAKFYEQLGFSFEYHKHGNSPYHYSTSIGKTVIEIYPLAKGQTEPDKNLRLGFEVNDFEQVVIDLKESGVSFSMEPQQTDFGFMTIVIDPDGRKVEVYKAE